MFAVLSLYKEKGESSFAALTRVKKFYNTSKVGHAGTLDPLAEGVLAVAVGEATKLLPYFNDEPKVYRVQICFGYQTQTLDAEGVDLNQVIKDASVLKFGFNLKDFETVLNSFLGEIDQIPPLFSAVKIDGKRAYDLARNAASEQEFLASESKLKSRKVNLLSARILKFELPLVELEIECSTGFYVRSLVRDLAQKLHEKAFMSNLIRTQVGVFNISKELEATLDPSEFLKNFSRLDLSETEYLDLRNGKLIPLNFCNDNFAIKFGFFSGNLVSVMQLVDENNLKAIKNLNI